ncbi:MAG: alanine racemase [Bacteroidetes bacterium]|nr:alanine racemase [Bacteroidota bacterium]
MPQHERTSGSWIELSTSALKRNISYLSKRIGADSTFVSVIKGNAYGHGIEDYVPLAERCGVRSFATSDAAEAERACRVKRPDTKLMIMNMIDNADLGWALEEGIGWYVFDFDRLQASIDIARRTGRKAEIHIEAETGFNRTGFRAPEMSRVIDLCRRNMDVLDLIGVCTHFAGAESIANFYRIQQQRAVFQRVREQWITEGLRPRYFHAASSAAALTYPDTVMDLVRYGIAQYGFWPSNETRIYNMLNSDTQFTKDPLTQVLTWKSRVIATQQVQTGEYVGYGTSFMAQHPMTIAVIPVGYYHGYSRNLSNLGHVLIRGHKAPVIGMVNMNIITVDITGIPTAATGNEVVLIGRQGRHRITVSSFSDLANSVNYEMLIRLPFELPRVIVP